MWHCVRFRAGLRGRSPLVLRFWRFEIAPIWIKFVQISFEPGFGAYQGLGRKMKVPLSRILCFVFLQFWWFEGDFKNPGQTPVRTKLRLKRFLIRCNPKSQWKLMRIENSVGKAETVKPLQSCMGVANSICAIRIKQFIDSGTFGEPCKPNLLIENVAICNVHFEELRDGPTGEVQQIEPKKAEPSSKTTEDFSQKPCRKPWLRVRPCTSVPLAIATS